MKCQDIMETRVVTVRVDETVTACAAKMRDCDIGFVPVNDADGKCVGVITDRDLAVRVVAENKPLDTRVGDCMSTQLVTCSPQDDVTQCEQCLKDAQVSRVLIVDGDQCVGVISLQDIAKAVQPHEVGDVVTRVKEDGAGIHA